MPKRSFHERLQSYIGGLVRVRSGWPELTDQIGLLMGTENFSYGAQDMVLAKLLIDGKVMRYYFYPGDLEFIKKAKRER
jgi:hypothetical protein